MSINYLTINLVTKGLLNISNVTKGMVTPLQYQIVIKKKGGGSPQYDLPYKRIDEDFYEDIKKYEDIDVIKVTVNWSKKYKGDKMIEAVLIKNKIESKILKETGKSITVELIES